MNLKIKTSKKKKIKSQAWLQLPIIPTLGKQRLQEHPRLKADIFYRMSSRLAWATKQDSVSKTNSKTKTNIDVFFDHLNILKVLNVYTFK